MLGYRTWSCSFIPPHFFWFFFALFCSLFHSISVARLSSDLQPGDRTAREKRFAFKSKTECSNFSHLVKLTRQFKCVFDQSLVFFLLSCPFRDLGVRSIDVIWLSNLTVIPILEHRLHWMLAQFRQEISDCTRYTCTYCVHFFLLLFFFLRLVHVYWHSGLCMFNANKSSASIFLWSRS